jgi:hypothetical protein
MMVNRDVAPSKSVEKRVVDRVLEGLDEFDIFFDDEIILDAAVILLRERKVSFRGWYGLRRHL